MASAHFFYSTVWRGPAHTAIYDRMARKQKTEPDHPPALTGAQVRMARAALRWSIQDLAGATGLSWATVQRMEADNGVPAANPKSLAKVRAAFIQHGLKVRPQDNRAGPAVAAPAVPTQS